MISNRNIFYRIFDRVSVEPTPVNGFVFWCGLLATTLALAMGLESYAQQSHLPKTLVDMKPFINEKSDTTKFDSTRTWEKSTSATDSIYLFLQSIEILKNQDKKSEAFDTLEKTYEIQSRLLQELTAQNEYLQEQANLNAYRLKKGGLLYLLLGFALICLMFAIFIFYRWYVVEKDSELVGYVDLAESLQKTVEDKDSKLSDMEGQKTTLNSKLDEMSGQVADLFRNQYKLFDKMIKIYYENPSSSREKETIYNLIHSEIDRFSKDEKVIAELEKIINKYKNNVLLYIKSEIPNISDRDFKLLCYIYAGFSIKSITVFTKETISNVLTRKHRLKLKIGKLNPAHAQLMIDEMP